MKQILVALDGSARAPAVLDAAIELCRQSGARLTLFRGVGIPPEIPQEAFRGEAGPLEELLRKTAEDYLSTCLERVPAELRAAEPTLVAFGSPWESVCHAARTRRMDLVVIGSHGYGGIDRLLGTTAAKIVNHAHCSVLVVRAAQA